MFESIDSYVHFLISIQDVAAYIKKEFDKKYNPTCTWTPVSLPINIALESS